MKIKESAKKYDIIIIGSGGAGCAAAIECNRYTRSILMITKSLDVESKTNKAQGGIQAAIGDNDSPELHLEDTLKAGNYKNDIGLAKLLTSHAPRTIHWLEEIGVKFDKKDNSNYIFKNAAGLSRPRVLSCGDSSGNKIVKPLLSTIKKLQIHFRQNTIAKSLIKDASGLFHLTLLQQNGRPEAITSKIIIIATGGLLPREKRAGLLLLESGYAPDGVELAKGLGARIKDVDLIQYHPTGILLPKSLRRMRLPETMRADGARFLDKDGNEFVDPLITRNKLTQKIVEACELGKGVPTDDGKVGVWLTTPDIDKQKGKGYTKANFPKFYYSFLEHNHDITKKNVLVYPVVHYSLGGICINENAETTIENLFAAGETTYGVHGEDRLMGNSLLDIFVFGRIAGQSAGKRILKLNE